MSKTFIFLSFVFFLIITSCEVFSGLKDDDSDGYNIESLKGEWEQTDPDPKTEVYNACDEYILKLVVKDSLLGNYIICDDLIQTIFDPYTFDGYSISYGDTSDLTVLTIISLSSQELVVDREASDTTLNYRLTYSKQE